MAWPIEDPTATPLYNVKISPSAKLLDEGGVVSGDLRSCTGHLPKQSWTLLCSGWVRLSLAWSSRRHRPLLLCWPSCSWLRSWGSRPRGSAGSPRRGGTATAHYLDQGKAPGHQRRYRQQRHKHAPRAPQRLLYAGEHHLPPPGNGNNLPAGHPPGRGTRERAARRIAKNRPCWPWRSSRPAKTGTVKGSPATSAWGKRSGRSG